MSSARAQPPRRRRRSFPATLRGAAAVVLLRAALFSVAALLAACGAGEPAAPPVRVVDLLPAPDADAAVLAEGIDASTDAAATVPVDRDAAPIARLRVTARGDAALVRLSWKLASERRFTPYRALSFPVEAGGETRTYDIDLRREPYWTGHIEAVRLEPESGTLTVERLEALPGRGRHRLTSLKGLTVPSLPGSRRLEVELPSDLPRQMTFETWFGLLPRFDHPGVEARFRAWAEPAGGGEPIPWLDLNLSGHGETDSGDSGERGWQRHREPVRVPAGGRLVLETVATRDGLELPEGSAVWGAPLLVAEGSGPPQEPPLNLLLVVVDTLRADVVGAYGDAAGGNGSAANLGLTPNLDAFAARATRLDDLHAPAPWTLPSIATLLTGQAPEIHGAGRRFGDFAPTALGDSLPTLAGVLEGEGYYTAGVYNNIYLNPSFGLERGFDEYHWVEDEDDVIVDHALRRLEELRQRRLFLFVHLFGPHHPYAPPEEDCRLHAEGLAPGYMGTADGGLGCAFERTDVPTLGGILPDPRDWRWIEGLYRAEVAHTDRQVGRLLAGLDELGLAAHTVVAVVSDHGEAFYDRLPQLAESGYVQSDHGHTHFEELLRVPGLIHVPGDDAAEVLQGAAQLADIAPTLLGLLDLDPRRLNAAGGGRDLSPRWSGAPPEARGTFLSGQLLYGPDRWAARRGPWKLVLRETEGDAEEPSPGGPRRRELYQLDLDPEERRDVADDHPDVADDLEALARAELESREALRRRLLAGDEDVLNAAYLEWNHITKLRALGYLQ